MKKVINGDTMKIIDYFYDSQRFEFLEKYQELFEEAELDCAGDLICYNKY